MTKHLIVEVDDTFDPKQHTIFEAFESHGAEWREAKPGEQIPTGPAVRFRCPRCKCERLKVYVEIAAQLDQDDPLNLQTIIDGGDHHWDGESEMTCGECGYSDEAERFDTSED